MRVLQPRIVTLTFVVALVGLASAGLPGCAESGESDNTGAGGSGGAPGGGPAGAGVAGGGSGGRAGAGGPAGTPGISGRGGADETGRGGAGEAGHGVGGGATGGTTGLAGAPGAGGKGGTSAAGGGSAGRGGATGIAGASAGSGGTPGAAGAAGGGSGSVTCPSTALKAGDTTRMVKVGSANRSFILHVPAKYDGTTAVPLVVDFHPLGGSGQAERSGSPYPAQTDPEGVIMAFPSGLSGPSGNAWDVGPCCVANVDDVGFARALVADVETVACIDPKRVYAVGFSMGGGMSHYLACHAADVFAAVAPAAFDLLQENVGDCKPPRPITVISFRGTSDPVVSYAGGASSVVSGMPITFLGAKATFDKWAQINKCTGTASAADANNCQTYASCQGGVEVSLCTKQGGGHDAGNAKVGWPVLKRHTLP